MSRWPRTRGTKAGAASIGGRQSALGTEVSNSQRETREERGPITSGLPALFW